MKSSTLLSVFAFLVFVPGLALAATSAPAATSNNTSLISGPSSLATGAASLKGLSLFGAYDLTSTVTISGQNSIDRDLDKTFILGAEYTFGQFSRGLAIQIGGDYEFARTIQNLNGIQLTTWTPFAELAAQVTPNFTIMGGLNYGLPSLSNASGVTVNGKVGFQIGASFEATKNLAVDGRYRAINDTVSVSAANTSADLKMSGFVLDGRYMF